MNNLKIGNFLLQLREEKSLTQEEVASFIGVTNRAVSKWETGEGLPNYQAMMALSSLYGVTINEILNGERAAPHTEEPTSAKLQAKTSDKSDDYGWVNLLLNILAIVSFAIGILVFIIVNFTGNVMPGIITLSIAFAIGATCYGCSFIIKKRVKGLMVANNVLGYIAFAILLLGLSSIGYFQSFDNVSLSLLDFLLYLLLFVAPPSVFLGIFTYKALSRELNFKESLLAYGCQFLGIALLSLAAMCLCNIIIILANSNSYSLGYGNNNPIYLIGMIIIILIGIVFGIFSLKKRPLLGLIGSAICVASGLIVFIQTIGSARINYGSYYVTVNVYSVYCLTFFIFELLVLALAIVLLVFWQNKKKSQSTAQVETK